MRHYERKLVTKTLKIENNIRRQKNNWRWKHNYNDTLLLILLAPLGQPNMDAELFVRIGLPLQPLFMQRVHESIFGEKPAEPVN